jgi:hypothetical protein
MVRDTLATAYQHDTTDQGQSLANCDRESLGIWRQGAECNGREAVNAGQIKERDGKKRRTASKPVPPAGPSPFSAIGKIKIIP